MIVIIRAKSHFENESKLRIKPLEEHCAAEYTMIKKTIRSKADILFWINSMILFIAKRFYY